MKKMIKLNFYVKSNHWSRRLNKIKMIVNQVIKEKYNLNFDMKKNYYLNIILINNKKIKKLNKKFKRKNKITDVLTFVTSQKNFKFKTDKYCDIFFSAETIEIDSKKNNISFYDHFTHLLVHSFLHINDYIHENTKDFIKMKNIEIRILNKIGLPNPYILQ